MYNPIKYVAKDLNSHFSRKDMQIVSKPTKSCLVALASREIQIKTVMRYHFISTRKIIVKKVDNGSVGNDVEKLEFSPLLEMVELLWKTVGISSKKLNRVTIWPSSIIPKYILKRNVNIYPYKTCT